MNQHLNQLIEKLDSSLPHLREEAARELISLNDNQIVPIMIRRLQSPYVNTQAMAMDILGKIKAEQAIDGLIRAFHGQTWNFIVENGTPGKYSNIIESAAKALGQIGSSKAIDTLLNGIKSDDEFRIAGAVVGLSYAKDPRVFLTLIEILNSDFHLVRYRLAKAFGIISDMRAIPYLEKMLQDPSEVIRRIAAESLERLKGIKK